MKTRFMRRGTGLTRTLALAAWTVGAALLTAGRVEAQWWYGPYFGGPGPGSTVQGDIGRGLGYYGWGAGQYNLATAQADAINGATLRDWNQYLYLSRLTRDYQHAVRFSRARQRRKLTLAANAQRIRENPSTSDLANGNALNAVLEQLSNPRITLSVLRMTKVPLPGEAIRTIAFRSATAAGAIGLHQLKARDTWPTALQGEAFAAGRRAYQEAVAALERNHWRDLEPTTMRAVPDAVAQLRARAQTVLPRTGRSSVQAAAFLKELSDMAGLLQDPEVVAVLAAVEHYAGTTVADLVSFMQAYDLRFGPATVASQRVLYRDLYSLLIQQRDGVMPLIVGDLSLDQDTPLPE